MSAANGWAGERFSTPSVNWESRRWRKYITLVMESTGRAEFPDLRTQKLPEDKAPIYHRHSVMCLMISSEAGTSSYYRNLKF